MMKNLLKIIALSLAFISIILLPLTANAQDNSPSLASNIEKVIEKSTADENQVDPLLGIAAIASAAIQSADSSVGLMFKIISGVSAIIVIVGITLGILGYRSIDKAKRQIQRQVNGLHNEINKQHETITEASRCMIFTTNAMHEWQAAVNLSHADIHNEEAERRRSICLQKALYYLDQAASSASRLSNITVETWAHSMKAYIFKRTGMLADAIKSSETALSITLDHIQRLEHNYGTKSSYENSLINDLKDKLPSRHYNIACYYCLDNNKYKCMMHLTKAISSDSSYKNKAPIEKDLVTTHPIFHEPHLPKQFV